MKIEGEEFRTIWIDSETGDPAIIDQTELPDRVTIRHLPTLESAAEAIRVMQVRGAPLIGATAAYGLAVAMKTDSSDVQIEKASKVLLSTRPTAVNLRWALDRMRRVVTPEAPEDRARVALREARAICDEDVRTCESIGDHGCRELRRLFEEKKARGESGPLQILTHCNAGWLATVDWGTALSPIYKAHAAGIPVFVWVDETRPRNQGSKLTAFELAEEGIPHAVIVDNAGGHLMQHGQVDLVLVGSDRTTRTGDVCNKIGTYLKALAAEANKLPFYVALPISTIDWEIADGLREIEIEERGAEEVREISGLGKEGETVTVRQFSERTPTANPAFDVTPARYITGLITEAGIVEANEEAIATLR